MTTGAAITPDLLHRLTPHADVAAHAPALQAAAERFAISTPRRVRHWLAQVCEETGGLTRFEENLHYSAEELVKTWPSRFPTIAATAGFAGSPQALADKVYADRDGNTRPGDGWTYRGRGDLQLTFLGGYKAAGAALGQPYVQQPDLVLAPNHAALTAAWFFASSGCLPKADADDVVGVTERVNGGLINLERRRGQLRLAAEIWPG